MFYLMNLVAIIEGWLIGYFLGYHYLINPWERKYWNDINGSIPFFSVRKINYYNVALILLIVNANLYFLADISANGAKNEIEMLTKMIIISFVYYCSIIFSCIVFAKMATKRDLKKYFPTGEILVESLSPLESYKITVFKVCDGYVRCEILKISYNMVRTIYFNKGDKVSIEWIDNNTVIINGERLNAETGVYDVRIHPLRSGL